MLDSTQTIKIKKRIRCFSMNYYYGIVMVIIGLLAFFAKSNLTNMILEPADKSNQTIIERVEGYTVKTDLEFELRDISLKILGGWKNIGHKHMESILTVGTVSLIAIGVVYLFFYFRYMPLIDTIENHLLGKVETNEDH